MARAWVARSLSHTLHPWILHCSRLHLGSAALVPQLRGRGLLYVRRLLTLSRIALIVLMILWSLWRPPHLVRRTIVVCMLALGHTTYCTWLDIRSSILFLR